MRWGFNLVDSFFYHNEGGGHGIGMEALPDKLQTFPEVSFTFTILWRTVEVSSNWEITLNGKKGLNFWKLFQFNYIFLHQKSINDIISWEWVLVSDI